MSPERRREVVEWLEHLEQQHRIWAKNNGRKEARARDAQIADLARDARIEIERAGDD